MSELISSQARKQGKSWGLAVDAITTLRVASDITLHQLARCYPDQIKGLFNRIDEALHNKSEQQARTVEIVEAENKRLKRMLDQQTKVICQFRIDKLEAKGDK